MKIRCISNKKKALPESLLEKYIVHSAEFPLIEQKEYVVYAVRLYLGYTWYCICDDDFSFYPFWYISLLFELVDKRLSQYWIFNIDEETKTPYLGFPEWINTPDFYSNLIDGNSSDSNAIIFKRYKEVMDLEFFDSTISESAQVGDDKWLICPNCFEAWSCSDIKNEMVKCPKCEIVMRNPRIKVKK